MKRNMAPSDDEAEAQSLSVSNYHLEDDSDMPVSFSVLPILWTESDPDNSDANKEQVYLHGLADNGLQKIFIQVIAWKFHISDVKPEIYLLSKDRRWIKLRNPRKSFEDMIRTILITVHFLHCLKKNPKISSKSVWDKLCKDKELRSYQFKPSQNDLLSHMPLIGEAAKKDTALAKSKLLAMILEEKTGSMKLSDEDVKDLTRPGFIVDDIDNVMIDEATEESEAEDELFYSVCALCDNGGKLLCCDGVCMRSFHATEEDGRESICDSLGFAQMEVDEIQSFYCKNCQYNQHQCFACGNLGSSGKAKDAEVIKCASATCNHFYHPHCVAKLLTKVVKQVAEELERNIADGDPFTCPVHYCCVCKELENKTEPELQFAVCRRCPKSYHRKCLPRDEEDIIPRAWEGLLPNNRILIYCLNHEIDAELWTPVRDHIKFPNVKDAVQEDNTTKETKLATKGEVMSNKNNKLSGKSNAKGSKVTRKLSSGKVGNQKSEKVISGSNISRKPKEKEIPRRCLYEKKRSIAEKFEVPDCEENQPIRALVKSSVQIKLDNQIKPTRKQSNALPPLDADSERSLLTLFEEARSSITLESVLEKYKFPSIHTQPLRDVVEKTITMGKLEGSVDAVRIALRKLENGCSIKDVEAVCGRDVLKKILTWRIVDKLHWYVQNGDMIVDFCCGANDFSILMKRKLEETGKNCSYKNYDLLPTKNDFSFEMRDWMTVHPNELPSGSRLVMGLNPPSGGAKATLANKFIDKALEFKPKLLILIVPQETERLDIKRSPYNLVWEDENFLSGMSFYLPGSVDVNNKQIDQWNVRPSFVSLWSRPDWTNTHKVVAQEHGHLSSQHEVLNTESFDTKMFPDNQILDGNCGNLMRSGDLLKSSNDQEDRASMNEGQRRSPHHGNVDQEIRGGQKNMMSKSGKTSCKRKHIEENDRRVSTAKRQAANEMLDRRSSVEGFLPTSVMACPNIEAGDDGCRHLKPISEFGTTNNRIKRGPSITNTEEDDNREEVKYPRQRVGLYGVIDPDSTRSNCLSSHGPSYDHMGYNYEQLDSATEASYRTNPPAMERYASRLDESNHVMMGSLRSEHPIVSTSGTFERSVPQPGYGGFAPGPHPVYSRQSSAGWLDE